MHEGVAYGFESEAKSDDSPLRYDVVAELVTDPYAYCFEWGSYRFSVHACTAQGFPAMVGRYACSHPLVLSEFSRNQPASADFICRVLKDYFSYMSCRLKQGERVSFMIQPLHGFLEHHQVQSVGDHF